MTKKDKSPAYAKATEFRKQPRATGEIDHLDERLFRWRIHHKYVDFEHTRWGWSRQKIEVFFSLLEERLHSYEEMSWKDVCSRKHCHSTPIENIVPEAQKRLDETNPEIDTLYQVDVDKMRRVWGYRDRNVLYLIWYDPDHEIHTSSRR